MGSLPHFIIIGAMKAGTTTLFDRLGQVPGVTLPEVKEPHFFSSEDRWGRGVDWYRSLFEGRPGLTGEASADYADANTAALTASRIYSVVPAARLIYALRDPVDRIRSHYRHEVLRAREKRTFLQALADPGNEYLAKSRYGAVLAAFRVVFPPDQILVYRLEDLDADIGVWGRILDHLGLEPVPMPLTHSNVTEGKAQFTSVFRWLWERDLIPKRGGPAALRRLGRPLLIRSPTHRRELFDSASEPVDDRTLEVLQADQSLLFELLGGASGVPPYL